MLDQSFDFRLGLPALCLAIWILVASPTQAQEPSPAVDPESSTQQRTAVLEALQRMLFPPEKQSAPDETQDQLRDPTAPTDRILQRLPEPADPMPQVSQDRRSTTQQPIKSLPPLPKIMLRGMVLSAQDHGTAMLDVDGKSVSISLIPGNEQRRIRIPEMQFAAMKPALDQRAALQAARRDPSSLELNNPKYEMCLSCSFTADGIVFNLEAFTPNSLLLKAIPHGEMIIVRSETP